MNLKCFKMMTLERGFNLYVYFTAAGLDSELSATTIKSLTLAVPGHLALLSTNSGFGLPWLPTDKRQRATDVRMIKIRTCIIINLRGTLLGPSGE